MHAEFFKLLVEETPDALIATCPAGIVRYWSPGAECTFGYASAEAEGQSLSELIVPPDRREEDAALLRADLTSPSATFETLRRKRDGSLLYVNISTRAVRNSAGAVIYFVINQKDVTHLKVLRDSKMIEARYGDLLESTPDAIVIANNTGRIVLANGQARTVFGYSHEELVGQPIEILLPERYRSGHVGHRSLFFAQPRKRSMGAGLELYGRRRGGEEFPVEISLSPLTTDSETLVMSAIRDISDRRKAEQKFRGLVEAAPDAMVIMDGSGRIVLVNSQTEKLFGYSRAELLTQPIEILVPQRFRERHPAHRRGFFSSPNARPMGVGLELFGQRKDGTEFPVEISLSPLETEDGLLVSSSIRDVTERKVFEATLRDTNVKLEKAIQAKDRFLASMSHELRTPLNAIIGFTGTLLMRLPGPLTEDQERQLRTIQGSGRHLLSLINDLLDLAKIESGSVALNLEPVACKEVVAEVVAQLQPAAQAKGLALTATLPAGEVPLVADRRALSQILINLVGNAVKFTTEGRIEITVEQFLDGERPRTEIRVQDTGAGIGEEDQARLFQAFARMESGRHVEGTGLGLHLSQKLAELLGAHIYLQSQLGRGSVFTLVLLSDTHNADAAIGSHSVGTA